MRTNMWALASKKISITSEAYEALRREKRTDESFTVTILHLTRKGGTLSDSFGSWKMTDEEETQISSELRKGWRFLDVRGK
jgi:predicted CopG family antitoxin